MNALVATVVALLAVVFDALTAADSEQIAPASLRGSSIVLVLCIAAPRVVNAEKLFFGTYQRPLLCALLLLFALLGRHTGGQFVRAADGFFSITVLTAAIGLYCFGGVDAKAKKQIQRSVQIENESCVHVCAALLLYAALRLTRSAFVHAREVSNFELRVGVLNATLVERGYASASEDTSVFGLAAGVTAIVVAGIILYNESIEHARLPLVLATGINILCSVALMLSLGQTMESLIEVFGDAACSGISCIATHAARRFAVVNSCVAQTWVLNIAYATLAAASKPLAAYLRFFLGVLLWFVFTVYVWSFTSFDGRAAHYDYAMMISVLAVTFSFALNAPGASLTIWIAASAFVLFSEHRESDKSIISDPVQFFNIASTAIAALWFLFDLVATCFQFPPLRRALDVLVVVLNSLSTFNFLLFLSLLAAYDGAAIDMEATPTRHAFAITFDTLVPLLVTTPLVTTLTVRKRWWRRLAVWVVAPALVALLYLSVLSIHNPTVHWRLMPWPEMSTSGRWNIGAALVASAVTWLAVGTII